MNRAEHEILHGEFLGSQDTELMWGWGSPAGRMRAERRGKAIARGAALVPYMGVLEIGCGTGLFTEVFAQSKAFITAVDISHIFIKKAKARNLQNVVFREKRFEDCMGTYDAIIGSSILHHLDIEKALPRIYELLTPGGVISFAEPNMLNPQVFLERKLRKFFPYVSPDETAFVRWTLESMLQKTGFTSIEITPLDWLHPSVPESFIELVSAMERALEAMPFVREFSGSLYIKAVRPGGTC